MLLALLGGIAYWFAAPTIRSLMVVTVMLITSWVGINALLSRPRDVANLPLVQVLSHKTIPDKTIYVWTNEREPRYYRIPYSKELAEELQKAARGKRNGTTKEYGIEGRKGKFQVTRIPVIPLPEKGK